MQKFLPILQKSALFANIKADEILHIMHCLKSQVKSYQKGQILFQPDETLPAIMLVLAGRIQIELHDYFGNRNIIATIQPAQIFGEVYACNPQLKTNIQAVSLENSRLLFLRIEHLITTCQHNCLFHTRIIQNLLSLLSQKAYTLTNKINYLSKRTTREKLLSYLADCASKAHSNSFTVPFRRQELADFLAINRSAMCTELSKMRQEGIIDFSGNKFSLKRI